LSHTNLCANILCKRAVIHVEQRKYWDFPIGIINLSPNKFTFCVFLTFHFQFYLYNKFKMSIKVYWSLIYMFMCIIIFLRIIILSFQSHQIRNLSAGLGMVWNQDRLSCNYNRDCYLCLDISAKPSNVLCINHILHNYTQIYELNHNYFFMILNILIIAGSFITNVLFCKVFIFFRCTLNIKIKKLEENVKKNIFFFLKEIKLNKLKNTLGGREACCLLRTIDLQDKGLCCIQGTFSL